MLLKRDTNQVNNYLLQFAKVCPDKSILSNTVWKLLHWLSIASLRGSEVKEEIVPQQQKLLMATAESQSFPVTSKVYYERLIKATCITGRGLFSNKRWKTWNIYTMLNYVRICFTHRVQANLIKEGRGWFFECLDKSPKQTQLTSVRSPSPCLSSTLKRPRPSFQCFWPMAHGNIQIFSNCSY